MRSMTPEAAASTIEVMSLESDFYRSSDTKMTGLTSERTEPIQKHKKPLTRRIPGERNFTHLSEGTRRTLRPYTPTSYIGPHDGSYEIPAIPEVDFSRDERSAVEPFSAFRNTAANAYPSYNYFPNETCELVGCWQSEFHTHSIEEIMSHLGHDRTADAPELPEYQEAILKGRRGRTKVTKSTRSGSAQSATRNTRASTMKLRELEVALPAICSHPEDATSKQAGSTQPPIFRPPSNSFALAFRPALSK